MNFVEIDFFFEFLVDLETINPKHFIITVALCANRRQCYMNSPLILGDGSVASGGVLEEEEVAIQQQNDENGTVKAK